MYFKRFSQKDLDLAIATESITVQHVARILNFYKNNIFVLKEYDAIHRLRTVIPDITEIPSDDGLHYVHVESWPHIKPMCLKFARNDPCRWIYVTQDDERLLFEYNLDTHEFWLASPLRGASTPPSPPPTTTDTVSRPPTPEQRVVPSVPSVSSESSLSSLSETSLSDEGAAAGL